MSPEASRWGDKFRRAKKISDANQAFLQVQRKATQHVDPRFENEPPPSDEPPEGLGIVSSQQGGESSTYYNNHPQAAHQSGYPPAQQYSTQAPQYSSQTQAYSSPVQSYTPFASPQPQHSTAQQQSPQTNFSPTQQPSSSTQFSPARQFSSSSRDYSYTQGQAPSTYDPYSDPRPNYGMPAYSFLPDSSAQGGFVNSLEPRNMDYTYGGNVGDWNHSGASSVGYDQSPHSTLSRSSTMHRDQYPITYGRPVTPGQISRSRTEPASTDQSHICSQYLSPYGQKCTICYPPPYPQQYY